MPSTQSRCSVWPRDRACSALPLQLRPGGGMWALPAASATLIHERHRFGPSHISTVAAEAASIDDALEATRKTDFDLAIHDADLKGPSVSPVADALVARDIRFVFI